MENNFITKKCERCGEEVKVPKQYPDTESVIKLYQVTCPNNHKTHTFDYHRMKWLR